MSKCVEEKYYTTMFIVATMTAALMLLGSAYYYDVTNKVASKQLTTKEAKVTKYITIMSVLISIFMIALLFIIYFGIRERLVTLHTTK